MPAQHRRCRQQSRRLRLRRLTRDSAGQRTDLRLRDHRVREHCGAPLSVRDKRLPQEDSRLPVPSPGRILATDPPCALPQRSARNAPADTCTAPRTANATTASGHVIGRCHRPADHQWKRAAPTWWCKTDRSRRCRDDRPRECMTVAAGSYTVFHPARRSRKHKSMSSTYRKYRSSNPPTLSQAGRGSSMQDPDTQSTTEDQSRGVPSAWDRRVAGLAGHREPRNPWTAAVTILGKDRRLGCSAPSSSSVRGPTQPTVASSRAFSRRAHSAPGASCASGFRMSTHGAQPCCSPWFTAAAKPRFESFTTTAEPRCRAVSTLSSDERLSTTTTRTETPSWPVSESMQAGRSVALL